MTKTELILSKPNMSVADLITAARESGITLSKSYIYVVRSQARNKGKPKTARPAAVTDPIRRCVEQFTRELLPLLRAEAARAVGEALR